MITLLHPDNAPNFCFVVRDEHGHEVFVQTDTDYPGIASSFGWSLLVRPKQLDQMELDDLTPEQRARYLKQYDCPHDGTDGTVDCRQCGMAAGEFIESAREYLTEHEGATADDLGYF